MKQKIFTWYPAVMKWAIPFAFFTVATFPGTYWIGGIFTILVLFNYALEYAAK